ncbi:MAG TPA: hypothetical protein DDW27_18515, partial [Bacteroidales bacterium]|nr:hypothetical protein [Bacteroidales bacterium]
NLSSEEHAESGHDSHIAKPDAADYSLMTLSKQPFVSVFRTGGRIIADNRDIHIITSKSSGLVKFSENYLYPGVRIKSGQILFYVSGEQLTDDNTELRYRQIKSDLEKASANYERAENLISEKIITEEHYLNIKNEYEKTLNEFNNLDATFGDKGSALASAVNGYIKEIHVAEGQKVTPGLPLASVIMGRNLILKADVAPDNFKILSSVESANFRVGYSDKLFKITELNGRKISLGKSTGENSFYIPIYFRMDHDPDLIEGTFAEVFLIGEKINDAIIVPNSALMEEFGKLYVFVAHDHGDFVKRYVSTGNSDGENTMILSGLSENEKIVATGAYLIKLSSMTTSAPAHSHNH